MAPKLDSVNLARARESRGRAREVWVRRAGLVVVAAIVVLALFNVFGQAPGEATASSPAATLTVLSPARVRGGLLFEARFTIVAHQELKQTALVLGRGWAEGMTINTIEPSPIGEASRDGNLVLTLGHIPAGATYLLFMQLQVNPTNIGHRSQDVALYDGDTLLTTIDRDITIFP